MSIKLADGIMFDPSRPIRDQKKTIIIEPKKDIKTTITQKIDPKTDVKEAKVEVKQESKNESVKIEVKEIPTESIKIEDSKTAQDPTLALLAATSITSTTQPVVNIKQEKKSGWLGGIFGAQTSVKEDYSKNK